MSSQGFLEQWKREAESQGRKRRYDELKGGIWEGLHGNEEHVVGDQKEEDPCDTVAGNFAQVYPTVIWKAELISDEFGYQLSRFPKC